MSVNGSLLSNQPGPAIGAHLDLPQGLVHAAANTVGNAPAITAASVTTSADLTAAISSAGRSAPAPAAYPQPSPVDSLFQERTVRAPPVHTHIFGRVPFWRALDRPLPPTTRLATLC